MKKTKFFNKVESKWILIDAKDKVLGRLAAQVARILQGKTKATYSPNFLCGDHVVIINASLIRCTGNKREQKLYDRYSGYPGGIRAISLKNLQEKNPSRVIYCAIRGMLPKTMLAKRMIRRLKIYPGDKHEQEAQQPVLLEV